MSGSLGPEAVEPLLVGRFGRPYVYVERCESTQRLLEPGRHPEGAVAVAEEQTAGRGRLGRRWEAPAGKAILCSVLLEPPERRRLAELSLVAGVAVADALERLLGLAVQLKWPNDVMLRRTKVAGCLAEAAGGAVVLGVGLNVNQRRDELPAERAGASPPGSLLVATGRKWERAPLLAALLGDLEARYEAWLEGGLAAVYEGLAPRDFLRGRRVTVDGGARGTALLVDAEGRLRVEADGGGELVVESGEVSYER